MCRPLSFILLYFLIQALVPKETLSKKKGLSSSDFTSQEKATLERHAKCPVDGVKNSAVYNQWHQDKISDATLLCLMIYLEKNADDAWAWSMSGMTFDLRKQKQQGDYCFKQSIKLVGKHSDFVKEWHFIGPFGIGKTEFDGDPLAAFGGIQNASRFRFSSHASTKYNSELVFGGEITWSMIKQNEANEMVQVRPKVNWNDLVSSLGSMGITEWQGWVVGNIFVNEDNTLLSYQCLGVARCFIEKKPIAGDLYHRNQFWFPVTLSRGVHSIFIPLRSKVNANFQFSLMKSASFNILKPPFLPDVQKSYLPSNFFIPLPVSNLMAKNWLKIINVKVQKQAKGETLVASLAHTYNTIAPGQTKVVVISLELKDRTHGAQLTPTCTDIDLELKVQTSEGSENVALVLRCRNKGSSFLFTFLDHDGSVQHAAAVEPIGLCPDKICPVFLTLHGTTVPPQNQADSYKKMVRGEFEFGILKMWLLAPTRHGAHNWEGPGALTALAAIQALHQMSQGSSWLEMKTDPNKVLFAGHSMGGHGAWHLATHFPDRATGLISLAGWIKKEEYGDSNLFFRHDISTSHTDPAVKSVMESCVGENDVDKHLGNLKGIPVLARIGANDRTVHPYFVRRAVRLLKESEVDVTYTELPNLEHWWWDTKETNDGGCVNDAQIRKFISKISESLIPKEFCSKGDDAPCSAASEESSKQLFRLVTVNPAFGDGLKGLSVLQQIIPFRTSVIKINVTSDVLTLTTQNVECLQLKKDVSNRGLNLQSIKHFNIDGTSLEFSALDFPQIYCLLGESNQWALIQDWKTRTQNGLIRGPHNYGPARRIAERQFLICVGTQLDDTRSEVLLRHAAYIANQFFLISDAVVSVLEDYEVDKMILDDYNLIILGNPNENLLTEKYLSYLRDLNYLPGNESTAASLLLGRRCRYQSSGVGLMTLAPHGQGLAMILMGLSEEGLEDVVNLATPTIPPMARSPFSNLLPDFVITGPEVKHKGPGGFHCAGFWDNQWKLSASSVSCTC
ncbi:uncharacterized protein LOC106057948 [Biomphalaria glabrata]|uniref:Uncharacterized protein LOC106057948 n=1 Tax=Biomphalaria glabrata TaxID=6526 RepID=A0A9W3A1A7_BIOGL|nr:uncharacterized protein LOC106057948 [Biomphalaria glabrata]